MPNIIKPKRSNTAGLVPTTSNLTSGEIGVNMADRKVYINNGTAVVQVGAGTLPALSGVSITSPTNGQALVYNGTNWVNQTTSGSGDVVGPASATDNAITRFDSTTGKLIQNSTVTLDDSGNISNVNGVLFDTTPSPEPTATGAMFWDNGNGTPSVVLDSDVTLQLGQENLVKVYNGTGSTIANGSVVAVSGAQGQRPSVVLADADSEPLSAGTLGIATEAIANGAEGFVTTFGLIRGINTSAFTAGQPIWLSQTAGAFTATRPSAPAHTVFLGWVISVNASSGEVFVNISNGWELDELHNVLITSPASGNTLIYDATAGVWKNANLTDGTGITITEGAGTITIANSGVTSLTGTANEVEVSASTGAVTVSLPATINANTTGSAATLTTARTIQTNLASTTAASFNGSANITPGVTGTLPIANGGTGATTAATAISNLGGVPLAGNVSMTGSLYTRGAFGMKSSTIAGNPILYDVQDQSGNTVLEIGRTDGNSSIVAIDIHTGATATDYDTRLNFTGGSGVSGGGSLNIVTSALTWNGVQVRTGTVAVANGGTGSTTAAGARTNLGATTLGANIFTVPNPSAITFPRFNADNTISTLDAATFRTAIGAGTGNGTVTSVTGTSPVTSSGGATPAISLASGYGDTQNPYASKTANFFLAAPNGTAGVPTFRAIVAADIPTLNQNTTGTASNVTGTVAIANGGTGATDAATARSNLGLAIGTDVQAYDADLAAIAALTPTADNFIVGNGTTWVLETPAQARTSLGSTTVGDNLFTLTNPSAVTFPRFNADNTVSALSAADFRTAIGAGTGNGTVTSVTGTSPVVSSGGATPAISLASGYGDTQNPYASKTANQVLAAPNGSNGVPSFRALVQADIPDLTLEKIPDAWVKKSVRVATTANITLSGTQTIDGIAVVAGDRVLVKDQTTASQNGIYIVAAGAWTRSADADTSSEIAAAEVAVDSGTVNGGLTFDTDFKSTDTLGTTSMSWFRCVDTNYFSTVGNNFATLTNPSAITFPRINANNTVSALSAADFRTAIGAGTGNGTVTSVGMSVPAFLSVSGSPITGSGTLAVSYSGTALPVANGGTGLTSIAARSIPVANSANTYTTVTPAAGQSIRINAGNTAWEAYTPGTGTVTSVGGTGTVSGLTLTGTVTSSGNLTLGGNLSITADMIYDNFTATASQTTFTTSQTYTSGKISVFANGVRMVNGSDVTVTSGTSVVFATGLAAGTNVNLVYPI